MTVMTRDWLWQSLRFNAGWNWVRKSLLMVVMGMTLTIAACSDRAPAMPPPVNRPTPPPTSILTPEKSAEKPATPVISEVSPPQLIQDLQPYLEKYQPQVSILSPKPDEVLTDETVAVRFQVKDLPIFQDPKLGMGPHLEVVLDNQPYTMIYDVTQPLVLKDLNAGTHTLRVFASRPWHESFKNDGAYAQATFHVLAKTQTNAPDPKLPLLTYSRPTGSYGAEPIMLDFYLTNAPLHLVAQETTEDDVPDWRIRATVNGQSFVFDRWQPIYLKGFQKGKNWVKLEFLDESGEPLQNEFNTTARLITYEPGGTDGLSQLVRSDIAVAEARRILDPNYQPTAAVPVSPSAIPAPSSPKAEPAPQAPTPIETPAPVKASPAPTTVAEPFSVKESPQPVANPVQPETAQSEPVKPEPVKPEPVKTEAAQPEPVNTETVKLPEIVAPIVPSPVPAIAPSPTPLATPAPEASPAAASPAPVALPAPVVSPTPEPAAKPAPTLASPAPTATEAAEPATKPEPIATTPTPSPAPEVPAPEIISTATTSSTPSPAAPVSQ